MIRLSNAQRIAMLRNFANLMMASQSEARLSVIRDRLTVFG